MENGSFQNLKLSRLDFNDRINDRMSELNSQLESSPRTAKYDSKYDSLESRTDNRTPGTIDALLSQNEDLMSRLKVTLRRLALTEERAQKLEEEMLEVRNSFTLVSDQMLVWKEKETFWKAKNQELENHSQGMQKLLSDLATAEEKVRRFERYQEKIRTQVKPYIQQLKDYAQSLGSEIALLHRDVDQRDANYRDLQLKFAEYKRATETELERSEQRLQTLVSQFEESRNALQDEAQSLREMNAHLEDRSQRLDQSLIRQDQLENLVISLRRNKEDFEKQMESQLHEMRAENSSSRKEILEKSLKINDLEGFLQAALERAKEAEAKAAQVEEQLTGLRYLWTQKSEENEKLRLHHQSLEKLNFELSQRLNESRKNSSQL